MAPTPAEVLDALAGLRSAIEAAIATDDAEAVAAAVDEMAEHAAMLQDLSKVSDADDAEAWAPVADALHELMAWLEEPAPEPAKGLGRKAMTRDEKVRLAVAIATRGRSLQRRRRRTPGDVLLEAFEAGVGHLLRGTWAALKLTVRGIAAVSRVGVRAGIAGAVHVREYIRNGRRVAAHERGKAAGAHLYYR